MLGKMSEFPRILIEKAKFLDLKSSEESHLKYFALGPTKDCLAVVVWLWWSIFASRSKAMPYQTLPGLLVCGGLVCVVGFGMQASQYFFLDRVSSVSSLQTF
jgi:mannose/fructose/N-acetylgalactosamine-specific phosphotransferase system component IIC